LLKSDIAGEHTHTHTHRHTHLVGGESHELFGGRLPDGRHGDDPADVVGDDGRGGLVAQLLDGVLVEEPQSVAEHRQRRVAPTVRRTDRRLLVQVLLHTNQSHRRLEY